MSGFHARLSFSSADRWVECPGSVKLSEGLPPEPDTPETLEGNAADWVAKQYAAGNEVAYGTPTPIPGYSVEYDMIAGAKMWAGVVGYGAVSGVPVVSKRIHPSDCWGEPDGWNWHPIERILDVPDYKFGFDLHEPHEHWQTIGYALSILESLELLRDPDVKVRLKIVQPRAYHKDGPVRTWETTVGELRGYLNIMHHAAIQAIPVEGQGGESIEGVYRTQTGPHCLHCPARHHCKTLQVATTRIAHWVGRAERTGMDATAVGIELSIIREALTLLKARDSGLQAQAEQLARAGQRVQGWRLESKAGRLTWNPEITPEDVLALGNIIGKSMRKPDSLTQTIVTPKQAIDAGISAEMIGLYASRKTASVLVRDDGTEARRVFGLTT